MVSFTFEEATGQPPVEELEQTPPLADDPLTGELGVFQNPDGRTSTEISSTVDVDGRFFNIPTLVQGQIDPESIAGGDSPSPEQMQIAFDRFKERGGLNLPGFATEEEAIVAAQARSDLGGSTQKFQQPETFTFEEAQIQTFTFDEARGIETLSFTDLFNEFRKVDPSIDDLLGTPEVALQMQTALAGALPALDEGIKKAVEDGDVQAFTDKFKEVQEFFTFEPRSEVGKKFAGKVSELFGKFSGFIDRTLVEPNLQPGRENPLLATIGKTAGEGLLLLAPLKGLGKRARKLEAEKPAPEVPPEAPPETPPPPPPPGPQGPPGAPRPPPPPKRAPMPSSLPTQAITEIKPATKRLILRSASPEEAVTKVLDPSTIIDFSDPAFTPRAIATDPLLQDPVLRARGERRVGAVSREPFPPVTEESLIPTIDPNTPKLTKNFVADNADIRITFDKRGKVPSVEEIKELIEKEFPDIVATPSRFEPSIISGVTDEVNFRIDLGNRSLKGPISISLEKTKEVSKKIFGEAFLGRTQKQRQAVERATKKKEVAEQAPGILKAESDLKKATREGLLGINPQVDSLFTAIGKLGGINKKEIVDTLGLDPKDQFKSGVFGKPVLRNKGGLSIDGMMEALSEENYLKADEVTGQLDPREFEEKFFEEDSGNKQFSARQDFESTFDFNSEYENYVNSDSYNLNVGIPVEEISASIKKANENLKDAAGIAEPGVKVTQREIAKEPGIITPFRSPRIVAKKFPKFAPIFKLAKRAMFEQDTLRSVFAKRLAHVDTLLKRGPEPFKSNKKLLDNILLQGDMIAKNFTRKELLDSDVPPNVISAYNAIRSAYNMAFNIANKTRELRNKLPINKRTGYIPHFFHEWMVAVDGELVASARTQREAVSMANDAARAGGKVRVFPKQFKFPNENMQAAVIGDLDYFKVQKNLEDTFSMSAEEASELLNNFARRKGRSRFVGNFLERKGAKGWEKDLAYVHRHYFNMISRFSALDKFKSKAISNFERNFGDFAKDHTGIAKFTKRYINDMNGNPSGIENLFNSSLANSPNFSRFLGRHLGDRPSLQLASMTTNAVAIAKLGLFNVSSAAVNASQLMMANALLGPRWTTIGMEKAAKIAAGRVGKFIGIKQKANPDIGILKQIGVGLQQGLESGAGYSKFNQMGRLFNKSIALFQAAEWQLRAGTGLGAYHKALSEGMTRKQAIEIAKETNVRANFDYSIADSPDIIRLSGPPGQVAFQFKKFPIKALEFMFELKGAEIPRFWIPFVIISGFYALPGIEALKTMVLRLTGDRIDIELDAKDFLIRWAGADPKKKAFAKSIMFGAFSNEQLGGVDLSRRVGAGDFIPSSGRDLLGPFLSSAITAAQLVGDDQWLDAIRAITTAPGNLAVALRNDGEITSPWDRERLIVTLDTRGRVLKALGFTTTKESTERDVARILRRNAREAIKDEQKAIDKFIKALKSGDNEKIDEALTALAQLGVTSARIKAEFERKGQTKAFRTFLSLSRRRQAQDIELLEFLK